MNKKIIVFGNIFHYLINNKIYNFKEFKSEIINKKNYLEKLSLEKCDKHYIQYTLCKYILKILKKNQGSKIFLTEIKWGKHFKIQYLFDFFDNVNQKNICKDLDNGKINYKKCIKSLKGGASPKLSGSDFIPSDLSIGESVTSISKDKLKFNIDSLKKKFLGINDYIFIDFGSTNSKVFYKNDIKHINIHNKKLETIINNILQNNSFDIKILQDFLKNEKYNVNNIILFATAGVRNSSNFNLRLIRKKFKFLSKEFKKINLLMDCFVISGHLEGFLEMRVLNHKYITKLKKYNHIELFSMGGQSIQHIVLNDKKYTFEVDNRFGGSSIKSFCKKTVKKMLKKNKTKKKEISYSESL